MELDTIAANFFKTFARFEYALKASGYHCGDGEARSDFTKFAKSVPIKLLFENPSSNELREAIQYLVDHPPRKQMIKDGDLKWCDVPPSTNLKSDCILIYVRRIRNNLFHGGKFNGRWLQPERSDELMKHSLVILKHCLQASPEVDDAYHN